MLPVPLNSMEVMPLGRHIRGHAVLRIQAGRIGEGRLCGFEGVNLEG